MPTIPVATVSGTYNSGVSGVPSLSTTATAVDTSLLSQLITAAAGASTMLLVGSGGPGSENVAVPTAAAPTSGTWTAGDTAFGGGATFRCTVSGTPGTWVQTGLSPGGSTFEPLLATFTWTSGTLGLGVNTVDASGGNKTPSLPTPGLVGQLCSVEKIDSSANTVTVSGTIRGSASTLVLTSQFQSVLFEAESLTSWRPLADHRTAASLNATYAQLRAISSIAYAATITPALGSTGADQVYNIGTLTGNLTVSAPSGTPRDGQTLRFRLQEDGTGGWTVTWNGAFAFGTDVTAAQQPTTAGAKWQRIFEWSATDAKWRATGIVRGF